MTCARTWHSWRARILRHWGGTRRMFREERERFLGHSVRAGLHPVMSVSTWIGYDCPPSGDVPSVSTP